MAHQMGICHCGRKRHWPKGSKVGDEWRCRNCGTVWTLSTSGKPTQTVRSKKPTQLKKKKLNKSITNNKTNINSSNQTGCFPKGTMISTPEGLIDIANLIEGDFVVSFSGDSSFNVNKIFKINKYAKRRLWQLEFTDKSIVKTTLSHSFLKENKWTRAIFINIGDKVSFFENDKLVNKTVKKSYQLNEFQDVYNLYIENDYTFIANGVISHSFSYFRKIKMFLYSFLMFSTKNIRR